jgi:TldD protein
LKTLTDRALNLAEVQGATYADIRVENRQTQNITVKNGIVEVMADNESQGFGVRVIANGAWGFASSALLAPAEVDRVTALAVQIAKASALFKTHDVSLGPPVAHMGTYSTPVEIDPWQVSLDKKLDVLLKSDGGLRATPGVMVATGSLVFWKENSTFANS